MRARAVGSAPSTEIRGAVRPHDGVTPCAKYGTIFGSFYKIKKRRLDDRHDAVVVEDDERQPQCLHHEPGDPLTIEEAAPMLGVIRDRVDRHQNPRHRQYDNGAEEGDQPPHRRH